jgi:hypothetical protein
VEREIRHVSNEYSLGRKGRRKKITRGIVIRTGSCAGLDNDYDWVEQADRGELFWDVAATQGTLS